MLMPKSYSWKAARTRLPPSRQLLHTLRNPRTWALFAVVAVLVLLWHSMRSAAGEMQRFYCWGPAKSPLHMTANENEEWYRHRQTPVIFNPHKPMEVNDSSINYVNLNEIQSTVDAVKKRERVLVLTPIREASKHLPQHFDLLSSLTYPHDLIDLAFLVGDSEDDTMATLAKELERVQGNPEVAFHFTMIVEKDFGVTLSQEVHDRHSFEAQGPRRKALARARNYLLATALKPEHSWVYWRDVDIHDSPPEIIEDFVLHDRDILVPNVWFHRYREVNGKLVDIEGRFDYNSWQETPEALKVVANVEKDKDLILAEGYKNLKIFGLRNHMALQGDWREDKDMEISLDGIGGVNIIVKADVHRSGINFPCYAFENQAETEGFAKMAKRAGYGVYGLPNYVVWHIDTDEKPGNA
ncbi:hypothetical protein PMIN06_007337 [Paraphaeosphaeria minitans]|uniref:Mannan polymerase II complex ANP1 subunit n=1 Tax=Paraphaeosphaeria minitans TaxID=565426 RepID=A0A9P6KTL2_9PLEO|nr:hypothetical protein PMIN01_03725 [Paraphaeosphaeria minitans]